MKKLLLFILFLNLITSLVFSQSTRPIIPPEYPNFIRLNSDAKIQLSERGQLLRETFKMRPEDEFRQISQYSDELGYTHVKYQQYCQGVKVENGVFTVHSQNNRISHLSGRFVQIKSLNIQAALDTQQALQKAMAFVGATEYMWELPNNGNNLHAEYLQPEGELLVFDTENKNTRLAYKFDIYATKPLYRAFVYVDAENGAILAEEERIHHVDVAASGTSLYNGTVNFTADRTGSVYRLRQDANGNGIETYSLNGSTNYNSASDVSSSSANFTGAAVQTGVQAHWGAEQTHSYYLQNHGRNSFDGNGSTIRSYVSYSTNYANAFWDGQRMTYGDGDGRNFGPLVALDIVGHEISHGVTTFTANLVYRNESGALNESFSDIFGEAIERFATGSNNWQMGSDIGQNRDGALRNMKNPKEFGDPDTYRGQNWFTGSGDNGGVHINSGVQNKWFYILSEGESGTNDVGSSYNVAGIGMDKAADIAYRNLSVYLSRNSTYADARTGAIQAAIDLYGAGSNEVIQTTNAWYAVGVGAAFGSTDYCVSRSNNANDEWIGEVSIGSFTHSSGASFYSNFTSETIPLASGSTLNLLLTPTFSGSIYNEYWRIWIDYNNDGDFSDQGELAFDAGGLNNTAVSGSISVPASLTGTSRMRISMKYNAAPTACESFSYGEVEDYTVDFDASSGGDTEAPTPPTSLVALNVGATSAEIDWNPSSDNVGVVAYAVYLNGNNIGSVSVSDATLSQLTTGTRYEAYVTALDAAGNESDPSNTVVFTPQNSVDTEAPSVPANLSASNITSTGAEISWIASTDNVSVTGYTIFLDGISVGTSSSTSIALNTLSPSTNYEIRVSAYDAAGNESAQSDPFSLTTPGTGGGGSVLISGNSFETGWEDWNDGGGDCTRITSSNVSYDGVYSIRLRDNSGPASAMTSDVFDLSTFISVEFSFFFYPSSMESGEDFGLQYNDGSGWETLETYTSGVNFNNNVFYTASFSLEAADHNLTNNARFRLICDASSNADRIYIDKVSIIGNHTSLAGSSLPSSESQIQELEAALFESEGWEEMEWDLDLTVFPNPSSQSIQIDSEEGIHSLKIFSLDGKLVYQLEEIPTLIDISRLSPGNYFIEAVSEEEVLRGKFTKN